MGSYHHLCFLMTFTYMIFDSTKITKNFHKAFDPCSQFKLSTTGNSDAKVQIQRCMYITGWGKKVFLAIFTKLHFTHLGTGNFRVLYKLINHS